MKPSYAGFLIIFWLGSLSSARSQETAPLAQASDSSLPQKTVPFAAVPQWDKQRDLIDIYHHVIKRDTTARKDAEAVHLSIVPAAGYTTVTGFAGVVSANLGFYTTPHQQQSEKISSMLTSFAYTQYNQIILPIQANIWTKNDKYNIITDWRYMNYPSTTFGLGGHSNINNGNGYTIDFNYIKIHQALLRKISNNLYAGLGVYYDYFWNIRELDPPKGVLTDFEKYGLTTKSMSAGPAFRIVLDTRKNQINPDAGWYVNIVDRPNFTFMGSDNNWQSLLVEARKYLNFPASSKNVLAFWSYNWLTLNGKPPYLMLPSTGWDDFYNTGRGYIQGRYRGKDMVYFETEYRFALTHDGLLGGVIFANAQSFSKDLSRQFQIIAPGAGGGIRIRLNKYSGANLCLDYGWGLNGQQGISVNLGEVF